MDCRARFDYSKPFWNKTTMNPYEVQSWKFLIVTFVNEEILSESWWWWLNFFVELYQFQDGTSVSLITRVSLASNLFGDQWFSFVASVQHLTCIRKASHISKPCWILCCWGSTLIWSVFVAARTACSYRHHLASSQVAQLLRLMNLKKLAGTSNELENGVAWPLDVLRGDEARYCCPVATPKPSLSHNGRGGRRTTAHRIGTSYDGRKTVLGRRRWMGLRRRHSRGMHGRLRTGETTSTSASNPRRLYKTPRWVNPCYSFFFFLRAGEFVKELIFKLTLLFWRFIDVGTFKGFFFLD